MSTENTKESFLSGKEDIRRTTVNEVLNQKTLDSNPLFLNKNFTLQDYVWRPNYDCFGLQALLDGVSSKGAPFYKEILKTIFEPNVNITTTPKIELFEFEPKVGFFMLVDLFKAVAKLADAVFDNNKDIKTTFSALRDAFSKDNYQNTLKDALEAQVVNDEFLFKTAPENFYSRIISGKWLTYFELPYFGSEFLHGKGSDGWSSTDIKARFLGPVSETLDRFGLGGINAPWIPQFKVDGIGAPADEITCIVYLNNYKIEDFIKNFKFLINLVAGSFWMQEGLLQRGSNFYQVSIPGRMKYYLCTADMKVECCGKSRNIQKLTRTRLENEGFPAPFTNHVSIDKKENTNLTLIPDGYKLTLTFQSIIPNTFNAVMFGLENKDKYTKPNRDDFVQHWGIEFMKTLTTAIEKAK